MSGHTLGDQLDLDELLRLAEGGFLLKDREVSRIAAEVRRLRAQVERVEALASRLYATGLGPESVAISAALDG